MQMYVQLICFLLSILSYAFDCHFTFILFTFEFCLLFIACTRTPYLFLDFARNLFSLLATCSVNNSLFGLGKWDVFRVSFSIRCWFSLPIHIPLFFTYVCLHVCCSFSSIFFSSIFCFIHILLHSFKLLVFGLNKFISHYFISPILFLQHAHSILMLNLYYRYII